VGDLEHLLPVPSPASSAFGALMRLKIENNFSNSLQENVRLINMEATKAIAN
jgi:hypothetical protein